MKKIIFLLLALIVISGCEKQERIAPQDFDIVNIELYGAFAGYFVHNGGLDYDYFNTEGIDYTVNINVNGLDHLIQIERTLFEGFVGTILKRSVKLKRGDQLKVTVLNNTYPVNSLVYLRIYTHVNRKQVIEFEEFKTVKVQIKDNLFRDVELSE